VLREQGESNGAGFSKPVEHAHCPGCGATDTDVFFYLNSAPVNCSALWPSREDALNCPTGSIHLAFCESCGLIFNCRYKSEVLDYNARYDNSLNYSPTFRKYAKNLAQDLIERHGLHSKKIVDIGSGKGEFLRLLCRQGNNEGIGYDPSYSDNGKTEEISGLRFVQDYYGEKYASEPADFICCRHVLEHIPEPLAFLTNLRNTLARRSEIALYFEMPNAKSVFSGAGLWDIIYPHVSYFTEESLRTLFKHAGFTVLRSGSSFSNQFVFLEARLAANPPETNSISTTPTRRMVKEFETMFRLAVDHWSRFLQSAQHQGQRVAFWGAGAKGVTFLNVVPEARNIERIIDLNERKQGMYVPGTGQKIADPSALKDQPLDYVISLNPVYEREIATMLGSMSINAKVITDVAKVEALVASN
jgi:SAM-dependent methyltransferase